MMIHRNNPNVYKCFLLLECENPVSALECFMNTEEWNEHIYESKIVNRLDQNCYIIYEGYKSTGYFTRARDYVLLKSAIKKKDRYFLL